MLDLTQILTPQRTLCRATGVSKKRFFETAAKLFGDADTGVSADEVYTALLAREKLGSTALGGGIAIPHCRAPNCTKAIGGLITLDKAVDFEAPDQQNVDILFALLVPEQGHQEHLDILAGLARLLGQISFCKALRSAKNPEELYQAAVTFEPGAGDAAATI